MSGARPIWFEGDDLVLRVYTQPKASRDQIVGLHGDEIKLAITAPPVDGKANAHIEKYLSKQCKVPKSAITIEKGALGRHKQIRIASPKQCPEAFRELLPKD